MSSSKSSFAHGQTEPVWSGNQALGLKLNSFVPTRLNHPPPGTVPKDTLPDGVQRPKLFEHLDLPHSKLRLKNRV